MTSNNASAPGSGTAAGRRRALGRGPGTAPGGPEPGAEPDATDPAAAETVPEPAATGANPVPLATEPSAREPETDREAVAGRSVAREPENLAESLAAEPAPRESETDREAVAEAVAASEPETGPQPVARVAAAPEPATRREPVAARAVLRDPETDSQPVAPLAVLRDPETGSAPLAAAPSTPATAVAEPAAPGAAGPLTAVPGTAGSGTVASGGAGPRTAVPGTAGPGTVAPGVGVGGAVAVAAGEGVPDGVFKVRLANFEGPFDLLLQLISKHKLDVTEVALSKVTDEFMAHIRAMGPDWDLDQTTEFLVVAATLLDLKAARLLPAAEVEDEADLALLEARDLLFARLLQYRAYKQIADIFTHRLESEGRRYPRTVGLEPHHAELLPEVVISIGAEGFAGLAVKAMQPRAKPQVYVDHIHAPLVSVQEQAGIVVARLRELGEASFRTLVEDTDDTLTVVARFLALLELYREKAVALDQETALGELLVRWTGGDGDAQPRVTDEFDRPPEEPGKETKT
ncbi:segregation/condensation protein A [Streptomyces sp. FL07-04A]|nr:segregation/condensation protein A [Streptomyces sp. FL07-04A]MDX3578317.1 segregation/condensation protein A [Streptomyces sp. FL07-04A]